MKNHKDTKFAENTKKTVNRLIGWGIWLLIIMLGISLLRNIGNRGKIKSQIASEQAKVAKMKEDNARLQAEIAQTQGGDFIEKQIRDKLGLVKEGESIIVLPDEATLRQLAPELQTQADNLPDPTWKKWFKLFI